ncbi:MAG TPA: glycerophosphodiester phosphodiesterase [Acidimicrobiales bacterium]
MATPTAVQAHRGSPDPASGIRQNTLDAFARARTLGADGVELDVRLTADGGLAVHHDPVVEGAGTICELTTAELPSHVPLLADALEACTGMVVNIEIKNQPHEPGFDPTDRAAGDVVALVEAMDRSGSVVVSSFWSGALAAVRSAGAAVPTGLLVVSSFDPMASIAAAADLGCAAVHLPVGLVDRATVATAHAAGLAVAAWTVVDEDTLASVLEAGVDTVITDDVAMARRAVDGR